MLDVEEPPLPDTRCPECGAEPTQDSTRRRDLSALGYLHQDVNYECAECGNDWVCGIPIGESDLDDHAEELECSSCESAWMLVHRIRPVSNQTADLRLHLKCPECYHFDQITRDFDEGDTILMGYPQITGQTDGCDPHGYTRDEE